MVNDSNKNVSSQCFQDLNSEGLSLVMFNSITKNILSPLILSSVVLNNQPINFEVIAIGLWDSQF